MQQRQLRLGDILDDYCPRERRVTNHAIVAMVGEDVKLVRCATCDTEHEYKHAKIPRQRRKVDTPAALYAQVVANGPKRVVHESTPSNGGADASDVESAQEPAEDAVEAPPDEVAVVAAATADRADTGPRSEQNSEPEADEEIERDEEEGPVHRPLIRASLPKHEGQAPPSRPIPEFTIRQPAGRQNRFRPRGGGGGGGQQFGYGGNRSNGNGPDGQSRGPMRSSGGRPPQGGGGMPSRLARRHGPPGGRKRPK